MEINYLAHHVSKKGVQPSKKNLESIAQCPLPDTEEEHLERMRVIFDRLREHGLKLKPSKCEVFKTGDQLLSSPCEQERRPAVKEEPGVHRPMSSAGYVHEGEIFRWPGRTLQAFH